MEKIYYKNDFKLLLNITSGTETIIPDWNYELIFTTTGNRKYKCSYKDEIYKNMAVEDGKIWCYFNNHNLALGILKCLYISLYADSDFSDNDRKEIIISDLDVELVTDENDTTTVTGSLDISDAVTNCIEQTNLCKELTALCKTATDLASLVTPDKYLLLTGGTITGGLTINNGILSVGNTKIGGFDFYTSSKNHLYSDCLCLNHFNIESSYNINTYNGEEEENTKFTITDRVFDIGPLSFLVLYYSNDGTTSSLQTYVKTFDVNGRVLKHNLKTPTETTLALLPEMFYKWGEVSALNLTLDTSESNKNDAFEYLFLFDSGDTPTVLTLPTTIKWLGNSTILANKTYLVSIINNCATLKGYSADITKADVIEMFKKDIIDVDTDGFINIDGEEYLNNNGNILEFIDTSGNYISGNGGTYLKVNKIAGLNNNYGVSFAGSTFKELDLTNLDGSKLYLSGAFSNMENLETVKLPDLTGNIYCSSLGYLFVNDSKLTSVYGDSISFNNPSGLYDINGMFYGCSSLKNIILDSRNSKITAMSECFSGCTSILDISLNFDATNIKSMDDAFSGCTSLSSLSLPANVNCDLDLSDCPKLTTIQWGIINSLKDRTGLDSCTLTLSSVNKNLLTAAQKALITSKNWTIA